MIGIKVKILTIEVNVNEIIIWDRKVFIFTLLSVQSVESKTSDFKL